MSVSILRNTSWKDVLQLKKIPTLLWWPLKTSGRCKQITCQNGKQSRPAGNAASRDLSSKAVTDSTVKGTMFAKTEFIVAS